MRRGNIIFILLTASASLVLASSASLDLYKEALGHLAKGQRHASKRDLDAALKDDPSFKPAKLLRGKVLVELGDFDAGLEDIGADKTEKELREKIKSARKHQSNAKDNYQRHNFQKCLDETNEALEISPFSATLRNLRVNCLIGVKDSLDRGSVDQIISDWSVANANAMTSGRNVNESLDRYAHISQLLFLFLADADKARQQIRHCTQYDDSYQPCRAVLREIRAFDKKIKRARKIGSAKKLTSSSQRELEEILFGSEGIYDGLESAIASVKSELGFPDKTYSILEVDMQELACFALGSATKNRTLIDRADYFCSQVLKQRPKATIPILYKVDRAVESEEYEEAIKILDAAMSETDGANDDQRLKDKRSEVQILLRRSQTKDYYKVLGVDRKADQRTIKKAYRNKSKEYHPDKYRGSLNQEQVDKKMAEINEAYGVLKDDELRARFDAGDDPNDNNPQQRGDGAFNMRSDQFHHDFFGPKGGKQNFHYQQGGFHFQF